MGGRYSSNRFSHYHEARDPYAPSEEAIDMFSIRCGRTIKQAIDSNAKRAKARNDAEAILDQYKIREAARDEEVGDCEAHWEVSESRQRLQQIEDIASAAGPLSTKAKAGLEAKLVTELEAILTSSKDDIKPSISETADESEDGSH